MKFLCKTVLIAIALTQFALADMEKAQVALEVKDYKTALKQFKRAAKKNPEAQYQIALMYDSIEEFGIDDKKAFKEYLKAAKKGHAESQFIVFDRYRKGLGTKKDIMKGMEYLTKAADQKHEKSEMLLAGLMIPMRMFTGKAERGAIERNLVLNERGVMPSNGILAFLYMKPVRLDPDYEAAYKHLSILKLTGSKLSEERYAEAEKELNQEQKERAIMDAKAWIEKHPQQIEEVSNTDEEVSDTEEEASNTK